MDRDEMSNHYRGPSIDASYQASVHLAVSEEKIKCEKLTHFFQISEMKLICFIKTSDS
jgi:hypothetical protein